MPHINIIEIWAYRVLVRGAQKATNPPLADFSATGFSWLFFRPLKKYIMDYI